MTVLVIAVFALCMSTSAQSAKQSRNSKLFELVKAAKEGRAKLDPTIARQVRDDFSDEGKDALEPLRDIVGTWNCHIPTSTGGSPPFDALQTFGSDGTFVETSSLLGMGGEGPAHGVYERQRRSYVLAFELFVFDPESGESVGRVRVRASITTPSANSFTALTAVDFIDLDGTVIEDIDGGPFTATRLQARGL